MKNYLKRLKAVLTDSFSDKHVVISGCGLRWNDWNLTKFSSSREYFWIGNDAAVSFIAVKEIESRCLGFIAVFDKLSRMGCDQYLVTATLKYLILQQGFGGLERKMLRLNILNKIEAALALELSGDDFISYLENQAHPTNAFSCVLPDDMAML